MLKDSLRAAIWLAVAAAPIFAAEFSGTVTDAASGKPICGAIITAETNVTHTDANGQFHIKATGPAINARAYGYGRSQALATAQSAEHLQFKLSSIAPHAVYLSFWGVSTASVREPVLKLAEQGVINAVVVDVKGDLGYVSFPASVPMAREIGAQKTTTIPDVHGFLDGLHKRGIYAIGRIVTFKDNVLGSARPAWAAHRDGKVFRDREGLIWCDPFIPEVRDYNLDLAVAAAKAGFDEIEFDYVRFPDAKNIEFSEESTEENRSKTIDGFLRDARQRLLPYNVFLAADVFGYICWNKNDTGIGQMIQDVTEIVDYVSPMLYPSGFSFGIPNYRNPVAHPYEIVRLTLDRAGERTKIDHLRFHPWLQAFADYGFDKRQFGPKEIQAQIKAAEDFGAGGWLLWNPRNRYSAAEIRGVEEHPVESRVPERAHSKKTSG